MTLRQLLLLGTALGVLSAAPVTAHAQASKSDVEELKKQIDKLQKRVQQMEAKTNSQIEEVKAKQDAVKVTLENGKPMISVGDGLFEAAIRGRMHFDMASYMQDDNLPAVAPGRDLGSGANVRRSEISLEGKFMRDWEYLTTMEFGGSGGEAAGAIKNIFLGYTGIKPLKIQIGAIQVPFTMDDSTSSNEITFIERASPVSLATSFGAQKGRAAAGVRGNTNTFFGSLYYTKGVIGEGGIDEANNLVGRAAYLYAPNPDTNIHFGVSGTRVFNFSEAATVPTPAAAGAFPGLQAASAAQFNLQDRPEIRVDGTRLVSTGLLNVEDGFAAGPEFGFNWKNLYLQSEYFFYGLDRKQPNTAPATALLDTNADFEGWYVQGSWIVTGETKRYDIRNASFGAPRPASPLGMDGSFGAIELAARYSTVDLNDGGTGGVCAGNATQTAPTATSACIRGGEQDIITLGINWYPNRNVRFMLNYLFIDTDRQAYPNNSAAGLSGGPNAEIGQDVDVLALRSQFNF